MSARIVAFATEHVPDAARMFVGSLDAARRRVPVLPADLADIAAVEGRLAGMRGVAALDEDGRLAGYLAGWFPIAAFRRTDRRGAHVPEWAHGAAARDRRRLYAALYRAASAEWSAAGCEVHAITLLAGDAEVLDCWFWNGFGMGIVDAIRPTTPLDGSISTECAVRSATGADAETLAELDREHVRHYAAPPVLMPPPAAFDAARWQAFLAHPGNTAWLAEDAGGPLGFIRFDRDFDGSAVIESAEGVFISGAYVRPTGRGRGAATAMLDGALRHYRALGLSSCAVDFEGFNPEAAAFWTRHFTPVCYSLMRVPESPGAAPPA